MVARLPKPQKLNEQNPMGLSNPRDGVSWYQAVAFGRWLNRRMQGLQLPNPGVGNNTLVVGQNAQVRLPTEWEWQWAAQEGSQKRAYPWGAWQEGYANTDKAKLNRTVAVGMYPQGASPFGVLDMCGNLFEWCLNKYEKPEEVGVDESGEDRVLRGGSFLINVPPSSCVSRDHYFPYIAYGSFGFRVVLCVANAPL